MRLPAQVLSHCASPSNFRGGLDLLATWGGIALLAALAHRIAHPLAYLVALVLIAGLQNRLIVLAHETWHRKAFRSQRINERVGAWFYAYPVGTMFRVDRARHLAHHRLVGQSEDPDWSDYERPVFHRASGVMGFLLGQLFGAKVVLRVLGAETKPATSLAAVSRDGVEASTGPGELAGIAAAQLVLFLLFAWLGHWWEYFVLWAFPLATFASFFISFRALVEHHHPNPRATPEMRLADFDTNFLGRWFLSPGLFHLHALHHAYPSVPYHRKRELLRALNEHGVTYPGRQEPGYVAVLRRSLAALEANA